MSDLYGRIGVQGAARHVDPASGRTAADLARFLAEGAIPVYLPAHHPPEGFVERVRAFAAR